MKKLLVVLAGLALGAACSVHRPPQPPTPPTPPPDQQCKEGQACGCWHHPPDAAGWLYACCQPGVPGGVVSVQDPAQCVNPTPTPTPTPTPPPGPDGPVPPQGTTIGGDIMLRVHGNAEFLETNVNPKRVDIYGAIACCAGWAKVDNDYWPGAGEEFQDATHAYGADMWHWRIGPWTSKCDNWDDPACGEPNWVDVGGPYNDDGSWNQKYWDKVRAQVWHAYKLGGYAEIVPIDTWYIKACHFGNAFCPWPKSAIDEAYNGIWNDYAEKLVRKTVKELGCFGNVIGVTGNEEDLVNMKVDWLNRLIETWRDEEKKTGCGLVHMMGTGSDKDGVQADYQVTHSRSPITGPCHGRWCYNNEHNPEFTPEEEASLFSQARSAGQAWAAWRADAKDPEWEKRLELFKQITGGGAPSTGCFAPDPEDSKWGANVAGSGQMKPAVDAAKAVVGSKCGRIGPDGTIHSGALATLGDLGNELRRQGYCASGPWVDAIAILAPDGKWEEYHAVAFADGCYTGSPEVNPKWRWTYNGQNPTPPSEPPSGACTNPPAPTVDHFNVKEHTKGPNKTVVDSTPIVHDSAYCSSIGMTGLDCPIRQEGDPQRAACEAEAVGSTQWTGPGSVSPENPYQYWVSRGVTGTARVCSSKTPSACGQVQVTP